MQVERNGKTEKLSFTVLDTAETPLILYKDTANERQKSLLLFARVPLILYKDNASERQKSLLLFARVPLILYKDKNFIDKRGHIVVERILINLFLRSVSIKC